MTRLLLLPTELICRIIGYLEPTTELHKKGVPEEQRWDIRHWDRTVASVARTCRTLNAIATPLLYSRYEATFHSPIIPFIDLSTTDNTLHSGLNYIAIRTDGTTNKDYTPTPERLLQYCAWAQELDLDSFALSGPRTRKCEGAEQTELWRLISRAPSLESLSVTGCDWKRSENSVRSHDQPPVWLSPIVSATECGSTIVKYNGWFHKLHTLSFSLDGRCGAWLVNLLSLPSLRSLTLGSWGLEPYTDWEVDLVWPKPTASSSVRDLSFWDASIPAHVILRIADYCKALESFKCSRAWHSRGQTGVSGRQWWVEMLTGLQRHSRTLTSLTLDPSDEYKPSRLNDGYRRVQGFETMVTLHSLTIPWHVLVGYPTGVDNEEDDWKTINGTQCPNLRSNLPENLKHLAVNKSECSTPGCIGIEQALLSTLPSPDTEHCLHLQTIEFNCSGVHYYNPLPANFWRIQHAFQQAGLAFKYNLELNPPDLCKTDQTSSVSRLTEAGWADSEGAISQFARMLAGEGPAGVQIALRTGIVGLAGQVMGLLGLGGEWLGTEEAEGVLFGEMVGLDAG